MTLEIVPRKPHYKIEQLHRWFAEVNVLRQGLLLAIETRGANALFDHAMTVQYMRANDPYGVQIVRTALREARMPEAEIENLFSYKSGRHPKACACWRCVMRLQAQMVRSAAIRAQKRAARRA